LSSRNSSIMLQKLVMQPMRSEHALISNSGQNKDNCFVWSGLIAEHKHAQWTKCLQKVVRWFLNADDNLDSHQNLIITFWPNALLLQICMEIHSVIFALSRQINKQMYAKTINLLCSGNKIFVTYQTQRGVLILTPTLPPCVRPWTLGLLKNIRKVGLNSKKRCRNFFKQPK